MSDLLSEEDKAFEKVPDKTEYNAVVNTADVRTDIKIGGTGDKFVPNINMRKWNDEAWLNINHSDIVNAEKETLIDGKAEIEIGNNIHKYYIDENGHLEYEIVLKTKPISNKIELGLDFPIGLLFHYQDTLENDYKRDNDGCQALAEYLEKHKRPDNVIGSYYVRWNKKNNRYKTGKFCHIYRPQLTDSHNTKRWAGINIENHKLIIDCDFTGLIFPVIIDPTIGYTTDGGSDGAGEDFIRICRYACGETGTCNPGTFYVHLEEQGETGFRGVVYSDNSGTAVNEAKISSSEAEGTAPAVFDWATAAITVAGGFSNGVDYWIGVHHHKASISYDTVTAGYEDGERGSHNWEGGLPNPWSKDADSGIEISTYIDYSAVAVDGQAIRLRAIEKYYMPIFDDITGKIKRIGQYVRGMMGRKKSITGGRYAM